MSSVSTSNATSSTSFGPSTRSASPPTRRGNTTSAAESNPIRPASTALARDGALQLCLRHLRTTLDVEVLRLLVELLLRPPARPLAVRAKPAAAARRDVAARQTRRLRGLAGAGAFLVDGPGCDLLVA